MFTGIVETTGVIRERAAVGNDVRLMIESPVLSTVAPGDSVAISGVCLTAETVDPPCITVYLAEETKDASYLDQLAVGDAVNIERPLGVDDRLDGHLVQGHVDDTTTILERTQLGEDWRYAFAIPPELDPFIVTKGSVAVDGISLTVASRDEDRFEVAIIPETFERTTLSDKVAGDPVHLEVDVLARYVARQLDAHN